jgi:protein TonB
MTHALAMRATSLATSAAMLGAMVILALSATYVVQQLAPPDRGPVITSVEDIPPPPKQPEPPRPYTPPQLGPMIDAPQLPPLLDTTAEPAGTIIPFDPGPATITNPHWLQRPRDLARYYPRRAIAREMEGVVVLDCLVLVSGRLNCRVASETPQGWGFADAAQRIAADHRMAPAMRDGRAVEGRYRMNVPFELN